MALVLIVDDEPNIRRMLARLLEAEGHHTRTAADGEAAIDLVAKDEPDVVLLDLALPGIDGIAVLQTLRQRSPQLPIVMMSGRATLGDAVRATKLGAFHFIEKPLTPEAVLLTVASAAELRRARELSRHLTAQLGPQGALVGDSAALVRTRDLIRQMAATDARVLITGESGTGKELAATALHELSSRRARPFVRINSAAIPPELVESEMFGHEKGAFTGADRRRTGHFELADGGTLFLDEVSELGAGAQAKLLRALESGEIERIGGEHPVRVDVRVITATNRDLPVEIEAGRFREDLFYRLNVLPLHMPALRERLEDVPALVRHFLDRLHRQHGLATPDIAPDALAALQRYVWPGNVRELANVCERLAILHAGRRATGSDVANILSLTQSPPAAGEHPSQLSLNDEVDAFERDLIENALERADGNVAGAARHLRTDRANLYRRMRRLGIERP